MSMDDKKYASLRKILQKSSLVLFMILTISALIGAFIGTDKAHRLFSSYWFAPVWIVTGLLSASALFFIKGGWKRIFPFVAHGAVILIITGSITGSESGHAVAENIGFENKPVQSGMWLSEGESSDVLFTHSERTKLPFSIRLDRFSVEYYPVKSTLTIHTKTKSIIVEKPEEGEQVHIDHNISAVIRRVYSNFKVDFTEKDGVKTKQFIDAPGTGKNPAVLMDILTEGTTFSVIVFYNFQAMFFNPDGTPLSKPPIHIHPVFSSGNEIKDYISDVSVIENGHRVKRASIEVNKPLHWGGYHFYQASWRDGAKPMSFLEAVSDRGWFLQVRPGLVLLLISVFGYSFSQFIILIKSRTTVCRTHPDELPKILSRILQISAGSAFLIFPLVLIISGKLHQPIQYILISALWVLIAALFFYGRSMRGAGGAAYGVAFTLLVISFIFRWVNTGLIPLQQMFEVMLTISMLFLPILLILRKYLSSRIEWYDILVHIILLIPTAFVFKTGARNLPPALQSWYFIPHVFVYLLSYALMAKAFLLAGASIIKLNSDPDFARKLGLQAHGAVLLGYPFLTCGLILGALWAKAAWGNYWGWDPKELWSLVTWLLYTIYLHKKSGEKQSPRILNILIILGFAAVILTLTWVNLSRIFSGMHNYA